MNPLEFSSLGRFRLLKYIMMMADSYTKISTLNPVLNHHCVEENSRLAKYGIDQKMTQSDRSAWLAPEREIRRVQ